MSRQITNTPSAITPLNIMRYALVEEDPLAEADFLSVCTLFDKCLS